MLRELVPCKFRQVHVRCVAYPNHRRSEKAITAALYPRQIRSIASGTEDLL